MDKVNCGRCSRAVPGLYNCSICKLGVCTKCFLDNLMMCRNCLKRG